MFRERSQNICLAAVLHQKVHEVDVYLRLLKCRACVVEGLCDVVFVEYAEAGCLCLLFSICAEARP